MSRLGRAVEQMLNTTGSIVTIGLAVATLGVSAILDALWPTGIVVAMALVIVVLGGSLWRQHRTVKRLPANQARLDDLLALLTRPAVKNIEVEDFTAAWPLRITYPVAVLVEEFGDVEHRFQDRVLEKRRAVLFAAADLLAEAWAANAWIHPRDPSRLYVGVFGGEAEGVPELYERLYERANAIREPKWAFIDAHRALLEAAIDRGYDVTALKGDRPLHPSVASSESMDIELRQRFGSEA
ncbi:MAG: hypothetical protein JSS99_07175 [Actinobacteria bacterium]|nr:hypothetical protein [Actinomycetota bacterium]